MNSFSKKTLVGRLAAVIAASISVAALAYSLITYGLLEWVPHPTPTAVSPPPPLGAKLADHGTHMVYVPDGVSFDKKHWLLFALSPSGDARSMILKWRKAADRHAWVVAASKESKNGLPFKVGLGMINAELREVKERWEPLLITPATWDFPKYFVSA